VNFIQVSVRQKKSGQRESMKSAIAAEWSGWRILSSISPDRRRKVKRKKDYDSAVQSVRAGEE